MHFEVRSRKINPDCLKTKLIYWFLTLEVRVGFDLVTEGHCQGSSFCPSFCSDAVRSSGGRGGAVDRSANTWPLHAPWTPAVAETQEGISHTEESKGPRRKQQGLLRPSLRNLKMSFLRHSLGHMSHQGQPRFKGEGNRLHFLKERRVYVYRKERTLGDDPPQHNVAKHHRDSCFCRDL